MSKFTLLILAVALVAVSCSAEAPRFRKANFKNRQFQFFQRQEEALDDAEVTVEADPQPAAAPYPPAGVTPATPLELPTEAKPSQEYGPPSQEYGPPAEAASPSQEYGPPAEEPAVLVEEEAADEVVVEEKEVVLAEEPESERLVIYRVPSARLMRRSRPVARFVRLEHK
ncbi:hypothetical protein ACFFRR_010670 [Megaselia abdita]